MLQGDPGEEARVLLGGEQVEEELCWVQGRGAGTSLPWPLQQVGDLIVIAW